MGTGLALAEVEVALWSSQRALRGQREEGNGERGGEQRAFTEELLCTGDKVGALCMQPQCQSEERPGVKQHKFLHLIKTLLIIHMKLTKSFKCI